MEVGKRYRANQTIYDCFCVTPNGNAVISCLEDGDEYLVWKPHFHFYTEVKEPVVKYVHWYRDAGSGRINTWTTDSPEKGGTPDRFWEYLKTDRIECDG